MLTEKLILRTNHPPYFTENLGSNLIRVAKLLYNFGMELLFTSVQVVVYTVAVGQIEAVGTRPNYQG